MFIVQEKPYLRRGCEVFMVEEKAYFWKKFEGVNGIPTRILYFRWKRSLVYGGYVRCLW